MHPRILPTFLLVASCGTIAAAEPRASLSASTITDHTESGGIRFRMPLSNEGDTYFGIEATWFESFQYPRYARSSYSYYGTHSVYEDYYSAIASGTGLFVATPLSRNLHLSAAASALWTSAPMTLVRGDVELGYHFYDRFQTRMGLTYQRSILHRTAEAGTQRIAGFGIQLQAGLDFDNESESQRLRNGFLACSNLFVVGLSEAYRVANRR